MQSLKHGVLLGTLLIFGLLSGQVISQEPDIYCTLQISQFEQLSWSNNVSFSCQSSSYPESFSVTSSMPVTMFDVARANIDKNSFCQKRYLLASTEVHNLLRSQYAYIVASLLKLDHLTDYGTYELWSLYKDECWKFWKVNECERELKQRLQERAVRREQQRLQKKEEEKQQQLLIKKQKEQEAKNQKVYHTDLLYSDYPSPYYDARKQALVKTQKDHYQKYQQCREIDAQAIGLCMAHNIDYQKLQQCTGTAMQHQLYDEVADCYKKIARFFCQQTLGESILAQQSLEFAQCVTQATELEAMELAIALSDLVHVCTETACSIIAGVNDAVEGIADVMKDPFGTAKNLGCCLGRVMNYVAEAMVYADSESLGWLHYAQVLEQEHQYDAEYAQQVVDTIKSWVVHSSAQDKVRMVTRCIVDGVLYGNLCKVLSQAGKACCGLIADIPELRLLEEITEYGLMTEIGEIGLQGMEDLGILILKSEVDTFRKTKLVKEAAKNAANRSTSESYWAKIAKLIKEFDLQKYTHHLNAFSKNKDDVVHMFRNKVGKFADTIENRKRILKIARDKSKCFGINKNGVLSYAQVDELGRQVWVEVNPLNYKIRNCGFNDAGMHRVWSKDTGFKLPYRK